VAWPVTKPALFDAVSVKVRVPVTPATREVVPVTSPIPLLIFNASCAGHAQCSVTFPLVSNVAGLVGTKESGGGAFGTSQARKNWHEFNCGVRVKLVCPGSVRRCVAKWTNY